MNQDKYAEIQELLIQLDDLLELLYLTGNGKNRSDVDTKVKKKIHEIKNKMSGFSNDQSHKIKKIRENFEKLLLDYSNEAKTLVEEENKNQQENPADDNSDAQQVMDEETMIKWQELQRVKDLNYFSQEMVITQNLINQKLKEDSDNIDSLLVETEKVVIEGDSSVQLIADTSRTKRRKRFFALQAGGTLVGGILGSTFGAIGGFLVTNGLARWIGTKHQKKIDEVANM